MMSSSDWASQKPTETDMNPTTLHAMREELIKIASDSLLKIYRPTSRMTYPEMTTERNKLVKQYYGRSPYKNYAIGGVSGAVLGSAVSKALIGKGTIPAAAVSGIVGATSFESAKKKKILNRINTLSVALRHQSAPIRQAKRAR